MNPVTRYIRRIRNENKKRYAREYASYLYNTLMRHQEIDEPKHDGICYMAAQGVRLQLTEIFKSMGMEAQ